MISASNEVKANDHAITVVFESLGGVDAAHLPINRGQISRSGAVLHFDD